MSQFLAKQSEAHDRLERIRIENLQNDKHHTFKRMSELEAELSSIKNSRVSLSGSHGNMGISITDDHGGIGNKYQSLYQQECRARERSDNQSKKMEKKLMVRK